MKAREHSAERESIPYPGIHPCQWVHRHNSGYSRTTPHPGCVLISSCDCSGRERETPRASILYNTRSVYVVKTESGYHRTEIRSILEQRHSHAAYADRVLIPNEKSRVPQLLTEPKNIEVIVCNWPWSCM